MMDFLKKHNLRELFFGPETLNTLLKILQDAPEAVFEVYMHALAAMIR